MAVMRALLLKDEVKEKWLCHHTARLFQWKELYDPPASHPLVVMVLSPEQ
jgi:hypothetical protein